MKYIVLKLINQTLDNHLIIHGKHDFDHVFNGYCKFAAY